MLLHRRSTVNFRRFKKTRSAVSAIKIISGSDAGKLCDNRDTESPKQTGYQRKNHYLYKESAV